MGRMSDKDIGGSPLPGRASYTSLTTGDDHARSGESFAAFLESENPGTEEHGTLWSTEAEKRLVKKIDRRIMPCLFAMIVLNYLDRNALANARVQGIEETLEMSGSQFNTAIAVFFVGYIGLQIPSNMILTRVRPSLYLPGCMIAWGALSGLTAFARGYTSLITIRFFLGVVEAPFFPGALFLLSSWYTKKELALRMSILYTGSLLSGAFGGLLAAALEARLNNALHLEPWRWLFLIEAMATITIAAFTMLVLPDYPKTSRFLTANERAIAVKRMRNITSQSHSVDGSLVKGLKEAILDVKVWLLALIILTKTSAAAVTSFIPTLVSTFASTHVETLLLSLPPYVFAAACTLAVSYSSDRFAERSSHIIVPMLVAALGFAMAAMSMDSAERYASLFLMLGGVYGSYNVALAWVSGIISQPPAKRSAALAIVNVVGNLAQIYSPYLYLSRFGPRYGLAMVANVGFCIACVFTTVLLRRKLERENIRSGLRRSDDGEMRLEKYML